MSQQYKYPNPNPTRAAYLLDGLEGKWDALALNMVGWNFDEVIDELISRAQREQVVTPMAYRTEAQRPRSNAITKQDDHLCSAAHGANR